MTLTVPNSVYAERRARLAAQLGPDGIAIVPTAPERMRNRDSDFLYRHDSYFYYLTGFTEPGACLVLTQDGQSTLFCNPKDPEREIWDGYRLGPEAATGALGVDRAHSAAELDQRLPRLLENRACVWYPFATHSGMAAQVEGWLTPVRARARHGALCPARQADLCLLLDEMRLIKDAHELALMRHASAISANAHIRAMQRCARMLRSGEDVREYHLDAELLHAFRDQGSQAPAYGSIVAAGANACVLHYRANNAVLKPGELLLIDAGAEHEGYASDITRTFPISSTYSREQRALYELVLAAQQAAIDAVRPGKRWIDPHEAAVEVLTEGLLSLGLLRGTLKQCIADESYRRFYMHKTGHWLGLDVHDVGDYRIGGEYRLLEPGMVLTIEPGLYIAPGTKGVAAKWQGIGIRIEDDVVVMPEGNEVLTGGVPKDVEAIEALRA